MLVALHSHFMSVGEVRYLLFDLRFVGDIDKASWKTTRLMVKFAFCTQ